MTVTELHKTIAAELTAVLGPAEGDAAARIILEDVAGYDRKYLFINGDRTPLPETIERVRAVVQRVIAGEPVQYAVGTAQFMGNNYAVAPGVLIPRPETAGLVDMIVDDARGRADLRVLDIGTGSGCIAISLAKALPFSKVTAIDISADALAIARRNAATLSAKVTILQSDILSIAGLHASASHLYDIIVSNPPYITRSEAADMDARVLRYEPDTALFVPDDDPLLFYRAIADYALTALAPGGRLYFEINAHFPEQLRAMLQEKGFTDIDITRDYRGLYRYASIGVPASVTAHRSEGVPASAKIGVPASAPAHRSEGIGVPVQANKQ